MVNQHANIHKVVYFKDAHGIIHPYLDKIKNRINKLDYDCFIVVVGKERRGKCQPKNSEVLMADGTWKKIEDIIIGDIVLSPQTNGFLEKAKVIKTTRYFCDDVYDIIIADDKRRKLYSCSGNHLVPYYEDDKMGIPRLKHSKSEDICNKKVETIQLIKINPRKGRVHSYENVFVTSVKTKSSEVYGIEIKSDSQWYITDNKMITHNSTLAAQIGDYVSNGQLDVKNICMTSDQFLVALKECNKGDVLIFDEAGTNLYSRESMSGMNRMLTKAFMISGLKNICIIMCIPNFFALDNYIRQHRIDLLFYVPKRGKFKVYSARRAREISIKGAREKKIEVVASNTKGWFIKQYPKYIEEEYRKKEISFKMGYLKDVKRNIEGNYSPARMAEITGYSLKHLYDLMHEGKLKYQKVGGRNWIPKSEAERIVQKLRGTVDVEERLL